MATTTKTTKKTTKTQDTKTYTTKAKDTTTRDRFGSREGTESATINAALAVSLPARRGPLRDSGTG